MSLLLGDTQEQSSLFHLSVIKVLAVQCKNIPHFCARQYEPLLQFIDDGFFSGGQAGVCQKCVVCVGQNALARTEQLTGQLVMIGVWTGGQSVDTVNTYA